MRDWRYRDGVRRVAMLSVHTSPLEQPGTGDAGGMNVFVRELSKRLADRGVAVDVYTRATSPEQPPAVEATPGVTVRHVPAGPLAPLPKADLPAHTAAFAAAVLSAEAGPRLGAADAVHSHYWLSGRAGAVLRDRWGVPLVHSMHTMAKVKNASLADGDAPEPPARVAGEEQLVGAADRLVANTGTEAGELVEMYGADPARVDVVPPGVDLTVFRPVGQQAARRRLGLAADAVVLLFAGRLQPLKGPDVLIRAVAWLLRHDPGLRQRLVVPVVGGPSGSGLERPEALTALARNLGVDDVVRFVQPVDQATLVDWYAAATLVSVPSRSESFGLVAAEAQATGTPVVASAVGGLPTVVRHGVTGLLVGGHDPVDHARAIQRLVAAPRLRDQMAAAAARHATGFAWERTAERMLTTYDAAVAGLATELLRVTG